MSFFENTRKPVGLGGKIMVAMMNFGHSAMAEWGLRFLQPAPDAMVLDSFFQESITKGHLICTSSESRCTQHQSCHACH